MNNTIVSHIPENQRVIEFLYRCMNNTDTIYKKQAYQKMIHTVHSYWHVIKPYDLNNTRSSIKRKINEFLEGFPEEDIIYS
jgi:hypothetical protein